MKISGSENNKFIREEIAKRIKAYRIDYPMTREELAEKSGVSLRTIARIESGDTTQFDNIVNIMRALDCLERIDLLFQDSEVRPSQLIKNDSNVRKRASSRKKNSTGRNSDWVWKEDK